MGQAEQAMYNDTCAHVANLYVKEGSIANKLDGGTVDLQRESEDSCLIALAELAFAAVIINLKAHLFARDNLGAEDISNSLVETITIMSTNYNLALLVHK